MGAQELEFQKEMKRILMPPKSLEDYGDYDGARTLTLDILEQRLDQNDVRLRLKGLGLDVDEVYNLFLFLDPDNLGAMNMDDFALDCLRLKGNVRTATLTIENKKMMQLLDTRMLGLESRMLHAIELLHSQDKTADVQQHYEPSKHEAVPVSRGTWTKGL